MWQHKSIGPGTGAKRGAYRTAALALLCFASCRGPIKQADLQDFVETGETNVLLRSETFSTGGDSLDRLPSAAPITCTIVLVNPKAFDVSYTLGCNLGDAYFESLPLSAPKPSDPTHLSFSFSLNDPQAEHKTLVFTMGKYVASINKTYPPETFSVICDSPPHAAARLSAVVNPSDQKSVLAVLLPSLPSDDDLAQLTISWTKEGSSTSSSATYSISSLKAPPSPNPFSGNYDCYFRNPDAVAGYGCAYSVVVVDQAGQKSGSASVTSQANLFPLNYDSNGATGGAAPASAGYHYGDVATIAGQGSLVRSSYAFSRWNTKADGTGTDYSSDGSNGPNSLAMPAAEVTLYAQWYTNGVTVSLDIGQTLTFRPSAVLAKKGDPMDIYCTNAALTSYATAWAWYFDGALVSTDASLWLNTLPYSVGQHVVSCVVTYNGANYSGFLNVTVTQ